MQIGNTDTPPVIIVHENMAMNKKSSRTKAATKNYADTKAGKSVAKAGDTLTGNLSLSVNGDLFRTPRCRDLSGSKGLSVLLGSAANQCQVNQPVAIQATDRVVFRQGSTNIIRFGKAVGNLKTDAYQDIVMDQ
jgi:hypothetical protein